MRGGLSVFVISGDLDVLDMRDGILRTTRPTNKVFRWCCISTVVIAVGLVAVVAPVAHRAYHYFQTTSGPITLEQLSMFSTFRLPGSAKIVGSEHHRHMDDLYYAARLEVHRGDVPGLIASARQGVTKSGKRILGNDSWDSWGFHHTPRPAWWNPDAEKHVTCVVSRWRRGAIVLPETLLIGMDGPETATVYILYPSGGEGK